MIGLALSQFFLPVAKSADNMSVNLYQNTLERYGSKRTKVENIFVIQDYHDLYIAILGSIFCHYFCILEPKTVCALLEMLFY